MKVSGLVGPTVLADGAERELRLGRSGDLIVSILHGQYFEAALRGGLFHAVTAAAGVALAVAGTTAGVALANPAGSGVLAVLARVSLGNVSGTYVAGSIMHGVNTNIIADPVTGTAMLVTPALIGTNLQPACKALYTATLPVAQTALRPFALKAASPAFGLFQEDLDGQVILTPGSTWSLYVIGADTSPLEQVGVSWEEIKL